VDVVLWAPVVSAAVSVAGGAASIFGWRRARGERTAAAEQAKIATQAVVDTGDHVGRIAEMQQAQQDARSNQSSAKEREPWTVEDIPGDRTQCQLRNNSDTAKYHIGVSGPTVRAKTIAFVGPNRAGAFTVVRVNRPIWVDVTWHLREDRSDGQQSQQCPIN
jgi:hypothetical protein